MEQKKTLWIIAAVGGFLLVVLGFAWLNYSPKSYQTPSYYSYNNDSNKSSNVKSQSTQVPVPQQTNGFIKTNDEVVVVTDSTTVLDLNKSNSDGSTTIDLNALKTELKNELLATQQKAEEVPAVQTQEQIVPTPQNINITVNVPEFNHNVAIEKDSKKPVKVVGKQQPAEKVVAKKQPAAKVSVNNDSKATVKVAVSNPKPAKLITQYWVQVAAYSNKKGAENARSILDENRIPSDIFTYKDNKGNLFYRVRVGPYTTKSEAEYWRTRINKIDEFSKAESYVTSTTKTND